VRLALETSRAVNQLCGQPAVRSTACRELLIFDLELGVPATSKALAAKHSPFVALLGAYGEGVTAGTGDEGGIDFIYCAHQVRAPTITSCPLLPTIAGCCLLLPAAALHCLLLPLCYPSATPLLPSAATAHFCFLPSATLPPPLLHWAATAGRQPVHLGAVPGGAALHNGCHGTPGAARGAGLTHATGAPLAADRWQGAAGS
jgi:hypothetical protein